MTLDITDADGVLNRDKVVGEVRRIIDGLADCPSTPTLVSAVYELVTLIDEVSKIAYDCGYTDMQDQA